jgi:hypothetical protein
MTGELIATLVFDAVLAALLGVAIFYCVKLNKRIRELQDSRSELAAYVRQFDEATTRATANIMEIQNASKKITQNIEVKLEKANYLADDLTFLIERGIRLADQLETLGGNSGRASSGSDLKRAFREPEKASPATSLRPRTAPPEPKKPVSTLETMLKKAGLAKKPEIVATLKSQAERELQEAITSVKTAV